MGGDREIEEILAVSIEGYIPALFTSNEWGFWWWFTSGCFAMLGSVEVKIIMIDDKYMCW